MRTILVVTLLSTFILNACKKGESDPNFSFRTRKNRLTGRWQMKSGTSRYYEYAQNGSIAYSETFSYDETKYLFYNNPNYYYTGPHSFNMTYGKKGELTFTESFDGISSTYNGTWDFNQGIGEKKSKEQLIIHFNSKVNSQGNFIYGGNITDITYDIKELRNDKLVLFAKHKTVYPDGTSKIYEDSYTMKQE